MLMMWQGAKPKTPQHLLQWFFLHGCLNLVFFFVDMAEGKAENPAAIIYLYIHLGFIISSSWQRAEARTLQRSISVSWDVFDGVSGRVCLSEYLLLVD